MGLLELSEKWLKLDFLDIAEQTLSGMEKFIADLNRTQLAEGKRSDGSNIEPEYTPFTTFMKKNYGVGLGKETGHVTLFQTGDIHKSIFADIGSGKVTLDATDPKTNELLSKYGERRGLTDESIVLLRIEFWPKYIANIEKALS